MRERTLSLRTSAELKRIGEGPQSTLGRFGVTHAGDHRNHLVHHFDVGSLSIALLHCARSGLGLNTIGCRKQRSADRHKRIGIRKTRQLKLADSCAIRGDRSVLADGNFGGAGG